MSRTIKPYKRQKCTPKQKRNLQSFNMFTDILMQYYFTPLENKEKSKNK